MGRATIQPSSTTTPPPQVNHFSHPHTLYPNHNPNPTCSGCKLITIGKSSYSCVPCNFTLHQSCATLPKLITHPSHPCTLTLLTISTYPEGVFSCDACNLTSNGWSYHCTQGCNYDLHVMCASKPLKIRHHSHVTCHLDLTFNNPYPGTKGFSCDICRMIGEKQWLYRCHTCRFDIHLDCTTQTITTASYQQQQNMLQHNHSFPTAGAASNPVYQQNSTHPQLTHSASYPGGEFVNQPVYQIPSVQPAHGYTQLAGTQNVGMQQNNNNLGSNLVSSAMQGFVEGAFQSVGQTVMQDMLTSGGGSGGTGADTGGAYEYGESA